MKKFSKFISLLLVVALMAVLIAACGVNSDTGAPPATGDASTEAGAGAGAPATPIGQGRDRIRIAIGADMGTLSPAHIQGDFFAVPLNIFESLWYQDRDGNTNFRLAREIEIIDKTTWIVHLRDNVYFSNGEPLTAQDVVFSMNLHQEAGVTGQGRVQDIDLEASRALDDLTVEVIWTQFRFDQINIMSDMMIYHEASFTMESASSNPIGTGPFRVTEYVVNSHVFLERRDDYWGRDVENFWPSFQYLEFRIIGEPSQVVNALMTDTVDVARIVPFDYDFVSNSIDRVNVRNRGQATWVQLGFNVMPGYSIFNDRDARHAVAHAINRQVFVDVVFHGLAEVMKSPISPLAIDHEPAFDNVHPIYSVPYDIPLAQQLAQSSGLAGQTVRLLTDGTPEFVQVAEIIQNMLTQIDVTVQILNLDAASFATASRERTEFDLALGRGFAPTLSYLGPLANFVRFNVIFNNPSTWENSEWYLELAPRVFQIEDAAERRQVTYEMNKIYAEAALWYSMVEFIVSEAFDNGISGPFRYTLSGFIIARYLNID